MKTKLRSSLKGYLERLLFEEHRIVSYVGNIPDTSITFIFKDEFGHYFIHLDIYPTDLFEESIIMLQQFLDTDCIGEILHELETKYEAPAHPHLFSVSRRYYEQLSSLHDHFFVYDKMIYYKQFPLKFVIRKFDDITGNYNDTEESKNIVLTQPADIIASLFPDADAFGVKTVGLDGHDLGEDFVEASQSVEELFAKNAGNVKTMDQYDFEVQKTISLIVVYGGNPGGVLM